MQQLQQLQQQPRSANSADQLPSHTIESMDAAENDVEPFSSVRVIDMQALYNAGD